MRPTQQLTRGGVLVAALGLVAVTATACGSDPRPVVDQPKVSGGTTTVTLDRTFAAQLVSLKIAPTALGAAKLDLAAGTLSVPVSDGELHIYKPGEVTPVVQGEIDHDKDAGLTLTSGSKTVKLTNLQLDPGTKARLFGDVTVGSDKPKTGVALLDLDSSSLQQPNVSGSSVTLKSTTVKLDGGAAKLLNDNFGITALKGDTLVGSATVSVTTGT